MLKNLAKPPETTDLDARMIDLLRAVSHAAQISDPRRRITAAISEIMRLMSASMGTAVKSVVDSRTGDIRFVEMIVCGEDEIEKRQGLLDYLAASHASDPFFAAIGERLAKLTPSQPIAIYSRQQLIGDDEWYAGEHFRTVRTPLGLDGAIYAGLRDRQAGVWIGSGLHRRIGQPQFSDQEVAIVRTYLLGIAPLFESFGEAAQGGAMFLAGLSRRQRELVFALLDGLSAKQIAHRMGLTTQSVQTYTKRLFAKAGVSGRAEFTTMCHAKGVGGTFAPESCTSEQV